MKHVLKTTATIAILSLVFFVSAPSVFASVTGSISFSPSSPRTGQSYTVAVRAVATASERITTIRLQEQGDDRGIKNCLSSSGATECILIWDIGAKTVAATYQYNANIFYTTEQGAASSGSANASVIVSSSGTTGTGGTPGSSLPGGAPTVFTTEQGLLDLINKIGNWVFVFLLAIAAIFLIVAGFLYITAAADPAKIKTAREMLINALIGVVIALLARGVVQVIQSIIGTGV